MRNRVSNVVFRICATSALVIGGVGACGDDGHDVAPEIIVGGGIHDPGIDGEVNVYVIDEGSAAPIAGAAVQVGTIEGTTDADGLFVASGDSLSGPQTILAKATDYAAAMWVGVDGANVTVPLTRTTTTTPDVPQAELAGTIMGWDQLPTPAANHMTGGLVTYSQSRELGDDAGNNLPPPAVRSNLCAKAAGGPVQPCAWRINARAGTIAVAALMFDLDTKGTASGDDDTLTITGFAIKHPITVVDGVNQTGITLEPLPAGSTTTASVDLGAPPSGLTQVAGIVGVDLGSEGVLRLSQVSSASTSAIVPSLSAFSGATYELLGVAKEDITDGTAGESVVLRRGLSSASELAAGAWLPPPTGLASDRTSVSWTRSEGALAHIIELDTPGGGTATPARVMSIAIFDDSAMIALPLEFAPLPSGALALKASALDSGPGFDARDFEIEALINAVERIASDTILLN